MSERVVTRNKQARHDYEIFDTMEAGMVLQGSEVKSLRKGQADLKGSFARVEDEEVWLYDCHIAPYENMRYTGERMFAAAVLAGLGWEPVAHRLACRVRVR